jgi:hypothetical protein
MTSALRIVDVVFAVAALAMAVVSIVLGDADKSPVYLLLAYVLWRLGRSTAS